MSDGETSAAFKEQYRRAVARGRRDEAVEPRATAVRFDAAQERVVIELRGGSHFAFPPARVKALARATPEQLACLDVVPGGEALHLPALDLHIDVAGLLADLLGMRGWAGRYLGRLSTPAKRRAARINGKKGGRPRKRGEGS